MKGTISNLIEIIEQLTESADCLEQIAEVARQPGDTEPDASEREWERFTYGRSEGLREAIMVLKIAAAPPPSAPVHVLLNDDQIHLLLDALREVDWSGVSPGLHPWFGPKPTTPQHYMDVADDLRDVLEHALAVIAVP